MIDFNKVGIGNIMSTDWILSKVDDFAIMRYYFGDFKVGRSYCSKFDTKDSRPSTGFFVNRRNKLIYRDFRTGETWDCFEFVRRLYNCDFRQALEIIARDFGLIEKTSRVVPERIIEEARIIEKETTSSAIIQFSKGDWTDRDLKYWRLYEISQEELDREEIYPVRRLFINKKEIYNFHDQLRFAYPVRYGDNTGVKIYSPYDEKMKWLSSIPLDVPFGLNKLYENEQRELVIITKSKKDLVVLKKLFPTVIATQNESEAAFPESLQKELVENFKRRIVIFDNDETGVESCKKFNANGFDYFNIPNLYREKYKIKDPSDYVQWYGVDSLRQLFIDKNIIDE